MPALEEDKLSQNAYFFESVSEKTERTSEDKFNSKITEKPTSDELAKIGVGTDEHVNDTHLEAMAES